MDINENVNSVNIEDYIPKGAEINKENAEEIIKGAVSAIMKEANLRNETLDVTFPSENGREHTFSIAPEKEQTAKERAMKGSKECRGCRDPFGHIISPGRMYALAGKSLLQAVGRTAQSVGYFTLGTGMLAINGIKHEMQKSEHNHDFGR